MKNKICPECDAVNGVRATYCRKCNASIDHVAVTETVEPKGGNSALRSAPRTGPKTASPRKEEVLLPEKPAKPRVIYWPFVVSLVSMFLMFGIIVAFVLTYDKEPSGTTPSRASGGAAATTTVADTPAETTVPLIDISSVMIGDIADQTYSGEPITLAFSLSHDDEILEEGTDYYVTYTDNLAVGTAHAYFEGNGTVYTGSFEATFNIVSGDPVTDDPNNQGVVYFVLRLSSLMLGRTPTLEELVDQVDRLKTGDVTASALVNEIAFSDEAQALDLSDEDFVAAIYRGVLAREPDDAGLAGNTELLANGMSRQDLLNSIIMTQGGEFESLCNSLGLQVS